MNLVFAGTPAFAVPALGALLRAGHRVRAVYTQPDRPAGRGRKLNTSAVKQFALAHQLEIQQPQKLTGEENKLREYAPHAIIVIAYGLLLPAAVLSIPALGCINVHASLLPRWRGAAPIPRAIEAGDKISGVSIMQMEAGLDTGPVWTHAETAIHDSDTALTLHDRLAVLGAETLLTTLEQLTQGKLKSQGQNPAQACYAKKLRKEESSLQWSQPAEVLHRKIRALNPWPVASSNWRGKTIRLWNVGEVEKSDGGITPGTIVRTDATGVRIATGNGLLNITHLQAQGGKVLAAADFLNGHRLTAGDRLDDAIPVSPRT